MYNKLVIYFFLIALVFFSCAKNDNSVPSSPAGNGHGTVPTTTPTNFIYTGTMNVDKYDSSWVHIETYQSLDVNSKIVGTNPSYILSTTFNATSLKGAVNNSIPVNIPSNYFYEYVGGVGLFVDGVMNGYNTRDTLYYHVLYKDLSNNNKIFLDYSGKLTSSF